MNTSLKINVAIVEDDSLLRQEISFFLRNVGFQVFELNNGVALDDLLSHELIQIIILDLNLPGENSIQIAKRICLSLPNVGLIILTAGSTLAERIKGYDAGADLYLSKPIATKELVAVLHSLCHRLKIKSSTAKWVLNMTEGSMRNIETSLKTFFTFQEKTIMLAFIQAKNQTIKHEDIIDILSVNDTRLMTKRAIETMLSRLRKKLDDTFGNFQPKIVPMRGTGYQLCLTFDIEA
jgi:two-component system phosphate regulon response regulator OmpR